MTAPVTAPTSATLSTLITGLDAVPVVRPNVGGGAFGRVQRIMSTITPTATQPITVLNRMLRIPSNAIVPKVSVCFDAVSTTTFTGNIGLWYSDLLDGTTQVNAGNLTPISSAFFASAVAMGTLVTPTEETFAAAALAFTDANYVPSQSNMPIWQAVANLLALQTTPVGAFTVATGPQPNFTTPSAGGTVYVRSTDPGGFFDIGVQLTTVAIGAAFKFNMFADIVVIG